MKKLSLILFLILFSAASKAQSYGKHIDLYQDALLVNTDNVNLDYVITNFARIKKIDAKYSYGFDFTYKKLVGDTLKVIAIRKNPFAERPNKDFLILKSLKNGDMYSYEYFDAVFPFKVAKQVTPITQDVFCSDLMDKADRFSDFKVITSPLDAVAFQKAKENGPSLYYIYCRTGYSTPDGVGKRGVTFLFTDGSRKEYPNAEVDVKVGDVKYNPFWYSCTIELNDNDIKVFSEKKIKAYRLYCADRDIEEFNAVKYQFYLKCLTAK